MMERSPVLPQGGCELWGWQSGEGKVCFAYSSTKTKETEVVKLLDTRTKSVDTWCFAMSRRMWRPWSSSPWKEGKGSVPRVREQGVGYCGCGDARLSVVPDVPQGLLARPVQRPSTNGSRSRHQ